MEEGGIRFASVAPHLRSVRFGRSFVHLDRTSSTNAQALRLAEIGCEAGTVVVAEDQLEGRGRLGRTWYHGAGLDLCVSVLLRPDADLEAVRWLSPAAALAVCDALGDLGVAGRIHWPNDVIVGDRKLAGILVESAAPPGGLRHVVVGIGLNVNSGLLDFPDDLRPTATSLREVLGAPVDRARVLGRLLDALDRWVTAWEQQGSAAILGPWRERSCTLGGRVQVVRSRETVTGTAVELDPTGAIVVLTDQGERRAFLAGEVLRLLPG